MKTSFSALETFQQCPQKYKFQVVDKLKAPKSKEAVFGTLIHNTLKHLFTPNPLFPTLDEIIDLFRNNWRSIENIKLTEEEHQAYLMQGEQILRRFYAKNQPWNYSVVDLESRFDILIEDPTTGITHVLAGIMDRIDKPAEHTYEIIDYKTTRKMKSQEAVDNDLQLSLYHLGLTRKWPHIDPESIRLSLYYVKHNEKITSTRTKEQTERTKEHIVSAIRDIEKRIEINDFPPQPSALCNWCGYKALCPAWKFLYTKEESGDIHAQDAKKKIDELVLLKKESGELTKRVAELQRVVKEYMNKEGLTRVFGEHGTISKTTQERYAYDFEKIKQELEQANRRDIWETLLTPDEKKLKTITISLPTPLKERILGARSVTKKFETITISTKKPTQ